MSRDRHVLRGEKPLLLAYAVFLLLQCLSCLAVASPGLFFIFSTRSWSMQPDEYPDLYFEKYYAQLVVVSAVLLVASLAVLVSLQLWVQWQTMNLVEQNGSFFPGSILRRLLGPASVMVLLGSLVHVVVVFGSCSSYNHSFGDVAWIMVLSCIALYIWACWMAGEVVIRAFKRTDDVAKKLERCDGLAKP